VITIAGKPCSGKSAISKELESEYGFERFSMGDMFRSIAKEYNMDVTELNARLTNPTEPLSFDIDAELDAKVKEIGGTRIRDYVVLESRTGFIFIPESHKVYTIVSPDEQARRLLNSGRDSEKTDLTPLEAMISLKNRETMENERFLKLYKQDNLDLKNYDFVLNTTKLTIQQGSQAVYDSYLAYRERKYGKEEQMER